MQGKYYEEFKVGDCFITPARTITEADICSFAGLSGDYAPLHTDEEFMKKSVFGTRIAHGLLTLAVASGLGQRLPIWYGTVIGFLGINNLRFVAPVKPGDTIHVEINVVGMRETKPDRGIVTCKQLVKNQRGEIVLEWDHLRMMLRRAPAVQDENERKNKS